MKTFVYDAIKDRLIKRVKLNAEGATILDDSAFTNFIDVVSEGFAENARYGEYLYLEKKWDTAKNLSSLLAMGALIGRKRNRPESSTGFVIVSHTDDEGNNRLANYGKYFFDINESSNYDELKREDDEHTTYIQRKSLVPWLCSDSYIIPEGTEFVSSSGVSFFSTKSIKIKKLDKAYSKIIENEGTKNKFLASGGWDGIKYIKVPIIQGIQKNGLVGTSTGERNQAFKFQAENIEAGNNSISREYFYITIKEKDGTETQWVEIPMIQLAGPYDRVFETELSADGSFIMIKFGNGYSGRVPNKDAEIRLNYIETLGEGGNIEQKFQINKIKFPAGYSLIDPRTKTEKEFLSCINITPILGGKGIETKEDYRENAPSSYLKYYATSVKSNYEKKIYENSPYSLLNAKCFISSNFEIEQIDNSIDQDLNEEIANQMSLISNSLNITAIKSNGDKMNKLEADYFINILSEKLSEIKGPNDALAYCEPKFVKMAPSVLIKTYDLMITDSAVNENIKRAIQSEYSIFRTDFKKDFIYSKIIYLSSLFNFTDSVELQIDAIADIEEDNIFYDNIEESKTENGVVVIIPFHFSNIFLNDKFKRGFKNYKDGKKYCLRIDLKTKNGADKSLERTILAIDNRNLVDINDSAYSDITDEEIKEFNTSKSYNITGGSINVKKYSFDNINKQINQYNKADKDFLNSVVRIAQFPILNNNVLTNKFIDTLFSFNSLPSEIRYYETDNTGQPKLFLSESVTNNDDIESPNSSSVSSGKVYLKNNQYIQNIDINYIEEPDSDYSSYGYFSLPISYIKSLSPILSDYKDNVLGSSVTNSYLKEIRRIINDYLTIEVRAEPRADSIIPLNWNEIVFVDDDDITVEKEVKIKE